MPAIAEECDVEGGGKGTGVAHGEEGMRECRKCQVDYRRSQFCPHKECGILVSTRTRSCAMY